MRTGPLPSPLSPTRRALDSAVRLVQPQTVHEVLLTMCHALMLDAGFKEVRRRTTAAAALLHAPSR